jgi:hypothetical protein
MYLRWAVIGSLVSWAGLHAWSHLSTFRPEQHSISLSVTKSIGGGRLMLAISIRNESTKPLWIHPDLGLIVNDLKPIKCSVRDSHGFPVPYIGPEVKVGRLLKDNCIHLPPRYSYSTNVDFQNYYHISKGDYKVSLRYDTLRLRPPMVPDVLWRGRSSEVELPIRGTVATSAGGGN